jgi:hypothetical protein
MRGHPMGPGLRVFALRTNYVVPSHSWSEPVVLVHLRISSLRANSPGMARRGAGAARHGGDSGHGCSGRPRTGNNGWPDAYAISELAAQVTVLASAVTSARAAASELAARRRKRARRGTSPALVISALTKLMFPSVTPCLPK